MYHISDIPDNMRSGPLQCEEEILKPVFGMSHRPRQMFAVSVHNEPVWVTAVYYQQYLLPAKLSALKLEHECDHALISTF